MIITFLIISIFKDKQRLKDWTQEKALNTNIFIRFNKIWSLSLVSRNKKCDIFKIMPLYLHFNLMMVLVHQTFSILSWKQIS